MVFFERVTRTAGPIAKWSYQWCVNTIRRARTPFLIRSLNAYWQERLEFIEFFASRYFLGREFADEQQVHGLSRNLKCSLGRHWQQQQQEQQASPAGVRPKLFFIPVNEVKRPGGDASGAFWLRKRKIGGLVRTECIGQKKTWEG